MPVETPKQQFLCLSSISNYHLMPYPDTNTRCAKLVDPKSHVGYKRHILYNPSASTHSNPTSPRNRLMWYITQDESFAPQLLVRRYLQLDQKQGDIYSFNLDNNEFPEPPRPRKKRKQQKRIVSVDIQQLARDVGEDYNEILNCARSNRNLYTRFKEELVMEGLIRWRHHDENTEICVMTDYNSRNGNIIPGNFVHVTKLKTNEGNDIYQCTCAIYNHVKGVAQNQLRHDSNEELFPDETMTCMHCRYFKEELHDAYTQIQNRNTNLPWHLDQVNSSLQFMNDPVQLVGSVLQRGTTRFSVKGEDDSCAFVFITFYQDRCYAKCTNGICGAQMQNRKKLPKTASLKNTEKLCVHMQRIGDQLDQLKLFFPEYFEDQDNVLVAPPEIVDPANTEDEGITQSLKGNSFDVKTGLWQYPALSEHKPKEMTDENLVHNTEARNRCSTSGEKDPSSGQNIYSLSPQNYDNFGNLLKCNCGGVYSGDPEEILKAQLYTRIGVLQCVCYNRPCSNNNCILSYQKEAERRGIFFYSQKTAVGDEVAWDFINSVLNSKTSFRGFCKEMTRKYRTNKIGAQPFLTGNTFISYFFGWLAAFKIDFRKEVDPHCGYSPRALACDGTHIGVSVRNMKLVDPVTFVDKEEIVKPLHKRGQRVLIQDNRARSHLKYLTRKYLGKLKANEELQFEEYLISVVRDMNHPALTSFIILFTDEHQDAATLQGMSPFVSLLACDAAMISALPFESHECLRTVIRSLTTNRGYGTRFAEVSSYSKEAGQFLTTCVENGCVPIGVSFIIYIIERIEKLHLQDRETPPVEEIQYSYDPRKGHAYYFTESGNQLRKMPYYDIQGSARDTVFDELPKVDAPCTKNFPGVSYGGYGYLFLWFCPMHGHSYGFHLISGGEGRKDPFSSLFKFCKQAPKEVFYDFACGLSEYCLNREPKFFLHTRFWHDLFHAFGHKCGINFKSSRISGLEGLNTEICEQVNSFLQCIKYTASHLSQEHFSFFLQFFLYLLNKDKTARQKELSSVAVAGQL